MAPSNIWDVTRITGDEIWADGRSDSSHCYKMATYVPTPKKETKKERQLRISKERMLASRMVFNQKTMTINKIKQFAKPKHRLQNY